MPTELAKIDLRACSAARINQYAGEHVMGWHEKDGKWYETFNHDGVPYERPVDLPRPFDPFHCADDAVQLIEKLRPSELRRVKIHSGGIEGGWFLDLMLPDGDEVDAEGEPTFWCGPLAPETCDTIPEAIARNVCLLHQEGHVPK